MTDDEKRFFLEKFESVESPDTFAQRYVKLIDMSTNGAPYRMMKYFFDNGFDFAETPDGMLYLDCLGAQGGDLIMCYKRVCKIDFRYDKQVPVDLILVMLGGTRRVDGKLDVRFEDKERFDSWCLYQSRQCYLLDNSDPVGRLDDGAWWSELFDLAVRSDLARATELTYTLRYARRFEKARLEMSDGRLHMRAGAESARKIGAWVKLLGASEWLSRTLREMGGG